MKYRGWSLLIVGGVVVAALGLYFRPTTISLPNDVYRDHYHYFESHHGNVYVIRVVDGYQELWKYDRQGRETRLYVAPDLDFRVSADEKFVAVVHDSPDDADETENIALIKNTGDPIKVFRAVELGLEKYGPYVTPLDWSADDKLWLWSGFTDNVENLSKLDPITFEIRHFDLAHLPIHMTEFAFNPAREILVFSDYPPVHTADQAEELLATARTVVLYRYDLRSQKQEIVAVSHSHPFEPRWLDENTIEYYDTDATKRVNQKLL